MPTVLNMHCIKVRAQLPLQQAKLPGFIVHKKSAGHCPNFAQLIAMSHCTAVTDLAMPLQDAGLCRRAPGEPAAGSHPGSLGHHG